MDRPLILVGIVMSMVALAFGAYTLGNKRPEPKSYNDCILEHMPGTPTTGVTDIRRACNAKFPGTVFDDIVPEPTKN